MRSSIPLTTLFLTGWISPTTSLTSSPPLAVCSSLSSRISTTHHLRYTAPRTSLSLAKKDITGAELKQQLTEYLQIRKEANADAAAQATKGKIVGGTRGNPVLEYVSGAPVKEKVIEQAPNAFDYDELSKYGYSHLVTPIMDLKGGRRAVYDLMGMEPPPLVGPKPKKSAPELKIDRTGAEDKARYSGLKMGQVLDDDSMAKALERANRKAKEGQELRPKLMEEDYVRPFAEKRNTGPRQTPDWTPERVDEYAKRQGEAQDWARRAKLGEFVKDPFETLEFPIEIRFYAVFTAWFVAFACGRATPAFLTNVIGSWSSSDVQSLQHALQIPGLVLGLASLGSAVVCASFLAPERNRSALVWAVKGFFGGPLAITQLRNLDSLVTLENKQKAEAAERRNQSG